MTELSSQLKSLQIPDALSVLNLRDKRASILFEAHEAADLDIESVFSVGRTGLEGLEEIDPDFVKFEKTLFSDHVKTIERTQEPKEFNEKLDKKISEFLVCLSPYFLTKPAQKCLEWLIRRFRIHVFNTDSLMSCILPFHETNMFARVLNIISLNKQTEKWEWLAETQKSGSPLSKQTIIQHCLSDSAFLTFICEIVPQAIEFQQGKSVGKLKTLFSFYASVLLGIAESPANLNESRIGKLLPYLYVGLKSDISDYKASSYLVLSQISLIKTFKEQTLNPLIDQICKSLSQETVKYGIQTLECIYQRQNTKQFPTKSLKRLCGNKMAINQILELCEQHSLVCLSPALLAGLLNLVLISTQSDDLTAKQPSEHETIFLKIFQVADSDGATIKFILGKMLEQYVKIRKVSTSAENLVKVCQRIMQIFEKKKPTESDTAVREFLGQCQEQSETEWLQEIFMGGGNCSKFRVIPGTQSLLVVSLNHPDASRRKLAVQELVRTLTTEAEKTEDSEFARSALLQRLNDDDDSVFQEVLKAGSSMLQFIKEDTLIDVFVQKLEVAKFAQRLPLVATIIDIFKDHHFSDESEEKVAKLICCVIPCLLPSLHHNTEQSSLYKILLRSSFGTHSPFISGVQMALGEIDLDSFGSPSGDKTLIANTHMRILKSIASLLAKDDNRDSSINHAMEFANTAQTNIVFKYFLSGIFFHLLDCLTQEDVFDLIAKIEPFIQCLIRYLTSVEGKEKHLEILFDPNDVETNFKDTVTTIVSRKMNGVKEKNRFPKLNVFCLLLRKIIQKLPQSDLGKSEDSLAAHVVVFEILSTASGRQNTGHPYIAIFRLLLQEFLKMHFPSPKSLFKFLSQIFMRPKSLDWLVNPQGVYEHVDVIICALHIFKVCLETLNKDVGFLLSFESEVLPTLVLLLHHPLKVMREASMSCIQALSEITALTIDEGLNYLLNCVVNNDAEIIEDASQICYVLQKLFKPLCNNNTDVDMLEPKHLEDIRLLTKYFAGFILRSNINLKLGIATITSTAIFQEFLLHLIPIVKELTTDAQTNGLAMNQFNLLRILLQKFTPTTVDIFEKFPSSLLVFKTALTLGRVCPDSNLSVQEECLNQVNTQFFEAISSSKTKSEMFKVLLHSTVNSSSSLVSKIIRQKLTELPISSEDMAEHIISCKEYKEGIEPNNAKKARRTTKVFGTEDPSNLIESSAWEEVMVLLEIIQLKSNIVFNKKLVLAIFEMLSLCLEVNSTNQPSVEYMKQLLLSSLGRSIEEILRSGQRDILPQEKFSVEKIIECFRTSENPQTHHQALLVLGKAASLFPDLVLHNIMTIFTFMGANVLRQDDSYSFEIIKKTIDSVIPTLVKAGNPEDAARAKDIPNTDDVVRLVVRVFVDAVPYIPEHRRIILLEHLAKVLGAESNLYVIIAIVLEKLKIQMSKKDEDKREPADEKLLTHDFCFILMRNFSLREQTMTITSLVRFISSMSDEKQEETQPRRMTRTKHQKNEDLVPLFDTKKYSTKEIRQYKYETIGFISELLVDKDFVDKACNSASSEIENLYLRLLEEILQFVCVVGKKAETDGKSSSLKYWKVQQHRGKELIEKVYKLLNFDAFVNVTSQLMRNENPVVRKKAMELVGRKIKDVTELQAEKRTKLLSIAISLMEVSKIDSPELPVNKQVALQILKPLIQLLAKENADEMSDFVPVLINIFSVSDVIPQITASTLLCIGELCSFLSTHVIQYLPDLMPPLLHILTEECKGRDVVILSAFVALQKVVESLSKFMSPYLVKILKTLTRDDHKLEEGKASLLRGQIRSKICSLRQEISKKITPRILLPAIDTCFDEIVQSKTHSLTSLMEITQYTIEFMPRDSIKSNHVKLLAFFLKAFDIRFLYSERSEVEVNIKEERVIAAFCALVMKLSENVFRPMFLKIFNWCTSEDKSTRLLTFYRLCGAIADKLKGLFLLFAAHIIKPCAELIAKCNGNLEDLELFGEESQEKSNSLLIYIFDCLKSCFTHDSQGFINKERFEYLMSPLVDQIDNEMGGITVYNDRVINHLVPCLASFAVAVNDESCWKTLNYQVLLKTRQQSSQVRLAALKVLEEIHQRIGESYLILLPETIPFLAELMEDESFEVEKQCQHVINRMEEILGESLQKYF